MTDVYQQVDKATLARIGEPGPLPLAIAGWSPSATFDLEATDESFGLRGTEFWLLAPVAPIFDPDAQRLGSLTPGAPDPATKTVPANYAVIDLTADELAQAAADRFAAVKALVDAETDRRTTAGFAFRGIAYQSRDGDYTNFAGASTAALGAIVVGAQAGNFRWSDPARDFTWTAADNSETVLDAQGMFALGQAAMAHRAKHIAAGRALKNCLLAGDQIADVTDAQYWPV